MIECIVFDFDGTLVKSDQIKKDVFFEVIRDIPQAKGYLESIIQKNPTATRDIVFSSLTKILANNSIPLGDYTSDSLVVDYTELCEKKVINCEEMKGAESLFEQLISDNKRLYVNTATPLYAINNIIKGRGWAQYFEKIFGAPASKISNLKILFEDSLNNSKNTIVVGNGKSDYEAACAFDLKFIAVNLFIEDGGAYSIKDNLLEINDLILTM